MFNFFILTQGHFFIAFIERGRGKERKRNIDVRETLIVCLLIHGPTGDQTHNLGMCPDQELNLQPFGLWDDAPTNRATLASAGMCILH